MGLKRKHIRSWEGKLWQAGATLRNIIAGILLVSMGESPLPSALCAADKLATTIVPKSLYLALIHLSGEVEEYLEHFREALNSSSGKYALEALNVPSAAYKYGSSSIGTRLRCWATSVGSLDTRAGFILSNNLKLPGQ